MKRILDRRTFLKAGLLLGGTAALVGMSGCAPQGQAPPASSSLEEVASDNGAANIHDPDPVAASTSAGSAAVVYFSCTGNTKAVADEIAQVANTVPHEIVPAVPYTTEDLDYNADCRANAEQSQGTLRPELGSPASDVSGADVIYLGYPIWWGKAPRIILSFLEQADTQGKTIIPFCTSGGSSIEGSVSEIEAAAPDATVKDARRFSRYVSQADIDAWMVSAS